MQAQRGKFLSGLILVFGLAITLATLALIFIQDLVRALGSFPDWFNLFLVAFLLARLIALYMIWNFKRWGVYALFLLECLEVAMGLFVFTTAFPFPIRFIVAIPSFLILIAIWFLALRPKWQLFT
ncbi:MAG: hypothetical protein ACM3PY_05180 [Omnitrophica WOR_2 bacterium]